MNELKPLDYKKIKRWLRQGDITELAMKKKINRGTAYRILCGRSKNWEFLAAAYERAIQNAARFNELHERLKQIS